MKGNWATLAHAILAVGGLTLAYLVWTDDGTAVSDSEVTVMQCDPADFTRAVLIEGEVETTLEVTRGDDESPLIVITRVRTPEEGEPTSSRFVGSPEAANYLEQLAPFRASRSLGDIEGDSLEEIGLSEPAGTLALSCGSRTVTLELGGRAFGEGDRYVRQQGQREVFLVQSARITPLAASEQQLMQRALHAFSWTDVERMHVAAYGAEKELLQRNRRSENAAEWVDAADQEHRNELFGNWFSGYGRMRVQAYLGADDAPGADLSAAHGAAEAVASMTMRSESGEQLGSMEMQRVPIEPTESTTRPPPPAYYVRTETTRGWVRVPSSVADSFEEDLRPVLGLEPLEEEAPPPVDASETPAEGEAADAEGEAANAEGEAGDAEGEAADAESPAPAAEVAPTPAPPVDGAHGAHGH